MSTAAAPAAVVTRPSFAQLLTLAWPVIISRSAQVVVGVTDAVMVGVLGTDALAAASAGAINTFNLLIFPMGIVFIVSSFSAQLTGKGDTVGARRYGYYGLIIAVMAGVLSLVGIPFVDSALGVFSYTDNVKNLMADYMKYRLLSGGFAIGLEALGNYYGGRGNTKLPMVAQLIAMGLNVVFNWILIYGNLGAPALGVAGAAIASSIATSIGFAFLFGCFLMGKGAGESTARPQLRIDELWRTLRFGVPSGLNWTIEFAAFSFFINVVMTGLGTNALAAMMAVIQVNSVSFMPAFALASAGSIFVGQAIGAKAHDDVPRTVWLTVKSTVVWMGVVGLVYLVIPGLLMSAFAADNAEGKAFLEVGTRILMLSAAWQVFDACGMSLSEALRASGDTKFTFWARAVIAWFVFAPGAWVSVVVFGAGDLVAVGWMVIYLALLSLVLWLRFRTGKWRTIEMTEEHLV